jgi:TonB-linked SusC/RagA family outer membrane protein
MKIKTKHYAFFEKNGIRKVVKTIKLSLLLIFLSVFQISAILPISETLSDQPAKIKGQITDSTTGDPLSGVTIVIEGTSVGVITDANGMFSIEVAKSDAVLLMSFVGYVTQSIPINGKMVINVKLMQDTKSLEEVVVVGYGTQKKVNLTGGVSTVSAKQIETRPVTNIASALQGTMAGVTVIQNTGQPGLDQGTIRVRGIGTLSNSSAMVVVDGLVSSMSNVNPDDIESLTVLKDAASAAIYGSRAANGVILITTKKGKTGKTLVHYNAYIGKQHATRLPDFLPSWQSASLYNEAQINEGNPARYTNAEIQKFKDGSDPDNYPNTDWLGLFYSGSGLQQNHFFDVSGGTEKTQSLLSFGYFSQDGIVKKTGFDRYTTHFRINSKVNDHLTVNGNITYSLENFAEPTNPYQRNFAEYFRQINTIGSNVPYKLKNGLYGFYNDGNPMAWLETGGQTKNNTNNLKGILDGDLEIIKGLHFKPMVGYVLNFWKSKRFVKDIQFYDPITGAPAFYEGPNSLTDIADNTSVVTLQSLLQYDKSWGNHVFSVLGGYSQEYTKYSYLSGYKKAFLNNSLSELDAGPLNGQSVGGYAYEVALRSYFGRINYAYKSKYLLEGNIRYDGSSRFAPDNRWGLFPAFSAGWRISNEQFFVPVRAIITDLKIRGSWGKLGNQNIGSNYPYIATISSGINYSLGGDVASGIAPVNGANEVIKWEDTQSTDFGLDAILLKGKLTFTMDYFYRKTRNILMNVPVGAVYGFNAPVVNGAQVLNKGVEFELGYHGTLDDFFYDLTANTSFIKNEVTDLKGTDPIIRSYTFWKVGYPINSFYGYEVEGIFQTQDQVENHATQSGGVIAPGDLMYKDQNNDEVIDGKDRVYLGSYFPKVTYGVNMAIGWKGFDLTLFLQGTGGVKGFVRYDALGQVGDVVGKPTSIFVNHWTTETPDVNFPRLWNTYTQNNPGSFPSSFWVRNADYLRLKNLQLGYTLPTELTAKAGIQKLKIYYSSQNIFTITKFYKWVDPETPAGDSGYTYPMISTSTIGINVTF